MTGFLKLIVAISVIVVLFIVFWVTRYQPQQNQIASLNASIEQQKNQYADLQSESANLAKWQEAKVAYEQVLGALHQTAVPTKEFIPSFLRDIEQLVSTEKRDVSDPTFKVTSITPSAMQGGQAPPAAASAHAPAPPGGGSLEGGKTTIQLNFTGRFNTIVDFLQQLSNLKLNKVVTIQQLSLSPSGTAGGGSPTLTVSMPFQIYMIGGG